MKRLFVFVLILLVMASCSHKANKVGDILAVNGELGVVFVVTPDGQHGKVMSVTEINCNWHDAKSWSLNLGNGWKLPTKDELLMICKNKDAINLSLQTIGYNLLGVESYWSSDVCENHEPGAWIVGMRNGNTYRYNKSDISGVRAVSAF